jgi:hypothetical protein
MQQGCIIQTVREQGPNVSSFRWSEKNRNGRRVYRKRAIGTIEQYPDAYAARTAAGALLAQVNAYSNHTDACRITVTQICEHFEQKELRSGDTFRSFATVKTYRPVPLHPLLREALLNWRKTCKFTGSDDWIFASRLHKGRSPYWGTCILRKFVRPVAESLKIQKRIGWHTWTCHPFRCAHAIGGSFSGGRRSSKDCFTPQHSLAQKKSSETFRRDCGVG